MVDETWTVEQLIEYAQSMDRAYQNFGRDGVVDRRKLAFGARKLARTRVMGDE